MTVASRKNEVNQTEVEASPTSKEAPRSALEVRLQKTKLCLYHMRSVCKHGSSCRFAHGEEELVFQPDLSKTRMCPDLLAGKCTNPNCQHAHRLDEIRATNFCYKTTQCMWYASGRCRNGSQCHFAHGEQDRNTWLDAQRAGNAGLAGEKVPGDRAGKKEKDAGQPWKQQIMEQQQFQQQQMQQQQRQQMQQQEQLQQREQQQALQKQLQQQQMQLQQLQQLQQQQQQQLLQQEQHKQLQEKRQQLQVLQMQQQQKQQQQHQAKDLLEPMFIQSSQDQTQSCLPLPGLLAMQQATTTNYNGYPMEGNAGVPPGLSAAPGFSTVSQTPYIQGAGYENYYASMPVQQVPEAAELNKVEALSKHIKSLRKQVKKLQDTMNHTMRSDSEQSTLSGAINTVSDSSSNDDFVPSKGSNSSDLESRQVHQSNLAVGNNYRHQGQAYRFAENKLVGA